MVRTSPLVVVYINDILFAATNAFNKSTALAGHRGWGSAGAERQVKVLITEVLASFLERIDPAGRAAPGAVGILIAVWAGE